MRLTLFLLWLIGFYLSACQASQSSSRVSEQRTIDSLLHEQALSPTHHPTLADFWDGVAHFVVDVPNTGLPMGESDSLLVQVAEKSGGKGRTDVWSYLHASSQSASVHDQCGDPVEFPGCLVLWRSFDGGKTFQVDKDDSGFPTCQLTCASCPCQSKRDQIDQQQYPRVVRQENEHQSNRWWMVYEYRANIMLRRSLDGLAWSRPEELPLTGIWQKWLMNCRGDEEIGPHPHTPTHYDCLVGSPPGIFLNNDTLYIFVGIGQNPGAMGCYRGTANGVIALFRKCVHNPLFVGATEYGPLENDGTETNPFFDFRTVSSAEVIQIGDRYYMLYEGVRGPATGAAGDTQFALGLARSQTSEIDGPWERFPDNPILVDQPGNVGLGHADLLLIKGQTYLYTSLDGIKRSRLVLMWN
ncbi:hypothetical protein KFU94_59885 [Chloroflexi bacterium TSY]|nr:hypothetical protein [Chloroflexi bacterium TSY]